MEFVQPLFLLGALAGALPVVIHLYNRRRGVVREFPAMALLMESHERTARAAKVRQWVLLALRALVLVVLALALAKPFVFSSSGATVGDRLPTAVAFVIDTSASMQHGKWWSRVDARMAEELGRLRPWDEVVVLDAADPLGPLPRFTSDHARAREAVAALKPRPTGLSLPDALSRATERLHTTTLPHRKIILISDMAVGGFPEQAPQGVALPYPTEVVTTRAPRGEDAPANLAVADVTMTQEGSARDQMWRIDVSVRNTSAQEAKDVEVRLVLDGQTIGAGKIASIGPRADVQHVFRHKHQRGGALPARVELVAPDAYPLDDTFHFTFRARDRVRALLVNGEPKSIAYDDELFFLTRALSPGARAEQTIAQTVVSADGLGAQDLSRFDVVILANLPRVSPVDARKLKAYVEGGGGLLIAMGDQVDVNTYNAQLADLLPKPLRGLKRLAELDDPDAPVKITHPGAAHHEHPIFRAFSTPGGGALQRANIYSYMLLEPSAPEASQVLLSFKDNAPALIERPVGQGRVLLWTSTVDREWTDLPIRTAYLPFVQRAAMYLARRTTTRGQSQPIVGRPHRMEVSGLARERVIVRGPLHLDTPGRHVLEPEDGAVTFTPDAPGAYEVWADTDAPPADTTKPATATKPPSTPAPSADRNRLITLAFSANVDRQESRLAALPAAALTPWQPAPTGDATGDTQARAHTPERRTNLWPKLLFLITILLLLETLTGTRQHIYARLLRPHPRPLSRQPGEG